MATFDEIFSAYLPRIEARTALELSRLGVVYTGPITDFRQYQFNRRLLEKRRSELEQDGKFTSYYDMGGKIHDLTA